MSDDRRAAYWDERYAARELVWSAGPNQFVADRLSGLAPGRALDLASGEGRNAIWLAEQGWQVTALDFSAVATERGRGRRPDLAERLDWRVADVVSAAYPDALDLVLIAYLHLVHADMATVVRRAREALRVGGTFLLVAHDASNIADGVGGPQDPDVLCTADDVVGWLGRDADVAEAGRVVRETDAGAAYDLVVRAVRTG